METALKVELITYTPEPEKIIAAAAKLCYSQSDIHTLMESLTPEKVESFIHMLGSLGHESPFEHISFTFGIQGVSRSLTHQLVRHRIGSSYSQKSQRYVKEGQFEYIMPPSIQENIKARELFIKAMEDDQKTYDELVELLGAQQYEISVAQGKEEKEAKRQAEKSAIEDARFVLPNACETKIVVTMNARALFNFFHHRCCTRAQWEIRACSTQMLRLVKEVAPTVFSRSGPRCVGGKCPEGTMTCGKMKEMQVKFASINL